MEDHPHVVEHAAVERREQGVGVEDVIEPQRHQIPPLLGLVEPIGDEDAIEAPLIQRPDQGAADEAGAAGDEDGPLVE